MACLELSIVNVYLVGPPQAGDRGWVLVDTGLPTSHKAIVREAERRFGHRARPSAIVLTHGHIDHVGSVRELAELWDVPVYAHRLEAPYLTGRSDYPPGDPTVGGGADDPAGPPPLLPARDRPRPAVPSPAGGRDRPGDARLALDPHAGAHARARLAVPGRGPRPDRRRRLRDHAPGVLLGRDDPPPGGVASAGLLHHRLGRRPDLRRDPRPSPARRGRDRPRHPHGRRAAAPGAQRSGAATSTS